MPTPQVQVLAWLHTQQDWLQEAVSRILTQDEISDTDIDELIVQLKTDAGQTVTRTRTFPGLSTTTTPTTLVLESISEVKGIDSLAPRNPLIFGTDNLTVIYGNNGSGKSGYTRILKKATGKANAKELKHNVYKTPPAVSSCKIKYKLNGASKEKDWVANSEALEDLLGVDIFDSDNAKLYLTKEKEASYTPPLVALFEEIVSVCKRISKKLEDGKRLLVKQLPVLPMQYTQTAKAKIYNGLTRTHSEILLSSILVFSDEDKQSIEDLEARLKAKDSKAQAIHLRKKKQHLDRLVTMIKSAYKLINQNSCKKLFELKQDAVNKRAIAIEANREKGDLFKLEGVGSETWRALWEAARKYSTEEAYKSDSFPKVEDAKCVLCHQDLDEDTQKRIQGFDVFVKSTLETDVSNAEKAYQNMIDGLPKRPNSETIKSSVELCGLKPDEWEAKIEAIWTIVDGKTSELIDENTEPTGLVISEEVTTLEAISKGYEATAEQYDKDALGFDRVKAQSNLLELKTKEWTSEQKDAILNEVQRLKDIDSQETWINLTKTKLISTKASHLSESIITEEYVKRFNAELDALGAKKIKVELVKTGARDGIVKHQIKLKNSVANTPLVDVLSEGEQRIISLAAFLADVTARTESTPFVFDDPISSLDQDFEEKTIDRLIKLSEDRQVLVFTHRLSFLGIISKKKPSIDQVHIHQEHWGSGEIGDLPFLAKNTIKSLNTLRNERFKKAEKTFKEDGSEEYYPLAKAICSDFRTTIEKIVETDMLSGVVERFRRDVQTYKRIGNLAKIEAEDCILIDEFMTKYSAYEHSQSPETPTELPMPDELEADLNKIFTWLTEFKGR